MLKQIKILKNCSNCGKKQLSLSSVNLRISDVTRKYKTSGRPIISTYNGKLCKKCLNEFNKKFNKIIIEI